MKRSWGNSKTPRTTLFSWTRLLKRSLMTPQGGKRKALPRMCSLAGKASMQHRWSMSLVSTPPRATSMEECSSISSIRTSARCSNSSTTSQRIMPNWMWLRMRQKRMRRRMTRCFRATPMSAITRRGTLQAPRSLWRWSAAILMGASRRTLCLIRSLGLVRLSSLHRVGNQIWISITKMLWTRLPFRRQDLQLKLRCYDLWSRLKRCINLTLTQTWAQWGSSKSFNRNSLWHIQGKVHRVSGRQQRALLRKVQGYLRPQTRSITSTTSLMSHQPTIRITFSISKRTLVPPSIITPNQTVTEGVLTQRTRRVLIH